MYKVYKILFVLAACSSLYAQVREPQYNISNSTGYGFDKKEPTYYMSFSRKVNDKFSAGLMGGIYNYNERVLDVVQNHLNAFYSDLPAGQYEVTFNDFPVAGVTYITSVKFDYQFVRKIQLSASIGMKIYKQNRYNWTVRFQKASQNHLPELNDNSLNGLELSDSKDITRMYYSLGIDYSIGRFNIGVFGDNIYSAGITAGVSF